MVLPAEKEKIAISERIFSFVENGIILAVFSIVAGIVGVFVDGTYFTVLIIPALLAIHRSKLFSGIRGWYQLVGYILALIIFFGIFYGIGVFVENNREHVP